MSTDERPTEIYDDFENRPRKKKGVPTWLWLGCGGGCLLMILLLGATIVLGKQAVDKMTDPERQWPELQKALPFDERPQDMDITGVSVPLMPFDQYILMDHTGGLMATVTVAKGSADEIVAEMMSEKPAGTIGGMGQLQDFENAEFTIQGEVVPAVTFSGIRGQDFASGGESLGAGVRLDLHSAGQAGVLVELRNLGEADAPTELDIEEFFADFRLW